MLGYVVSLADGTKETVPATRYEVDDDGWLVLSVGDDDVRGFAAARWVEVRQVGRRLTTHWPPDDLDRVLDAAHAEMCAFGDCGPLGPPESFASPLLNEVDAFVTEIFSRCYADPTQSYLKPRIARMRKLVRRQFDRS